MKVFANLSAINSLNSFFMLGVGIRQSSKQTVPKFTINFRASGIEIEILRR